MKLNVNLSVVNRPKCNSETYFDLDSHADTCVLGSNALGLVESAHPERTTDVSFAEPSVGTQIKKILSSKLVHTYVDRDSLLDELFIVAFYSSCSLQNRGMLLLQKYQPYKELVIPRISNQIWQVLLEE